MRIDGIYDIEDLKEYKRVKLELAFQSIIEGKTILQKVLEHNKLEGNYTPADITLVAYLRKDWTTGEVNCEIPLVSAYIKDIGELYFLDDWLNEHAFQRCKDYVRESIIVNNK